MIVNLGSSSTVVAITWREVDVHIHSVVHPHFYTIYPSILLRFAKGLAS
jgi:hypothetical protein